jgi:geranylgeranyl diphosphate synthase, type II
MIDARAQVEQTLTAVLNRTRNGNCPPRLAAAMDHAVFPGGARIRPQLCLAVAGACDADNRRVALAAAAAIELLHCASLVHDDLPCFDNAPLRRGKPSLHAAYGERLALLAGDALIVLAFQALAESIDESPARAAELFEIISLGAAVPAGLAAGQAWECEPRAGLRDYQRAKTGALFVAATMAGACAAGSAAEPWREMGERLGEACQVATEVRHDAPSVKKLKHLVGLAVDAIPACPMAAELRLLILLEARQYMPSMHSRRVA